MAVAKRIRAVVAMQKAWMQNDAARCVAAASEVDLRSVGVIVVTCLRGVVGDGLEGCDFGDLRGETVVGFLQNGELLRTVDFKDVRDNASGQREIKWFNASWLPVPDVVVVEPLVGASKNDPQVRLPCVLWVSVGFQRVRWVSKVSESVADCDPSRVAARRGRGGAGCAEACVGHGGAGSGELKRRKKRRERRERRKDQDN
eukprot:736762-Rhodomonas_salina.1